MITQGHLILGGLGLVSVIGQTVGEPIQSLFVQAPLIGALIYLWIFESRRRTQDETKRDERYIEAIKEVSTTTAQALNRQSESTDRLNITIAEHTEVLRQLEHEERT